MSRSLAASQGAILLVDATQGIQAQTLANFMIAFSQNLFILPVLNKIDLGHADCLNVLQQMESTLDIPAATVMQVLHWLLHSHHWSKVSAKSGLHVASILPRIISDIPAPSGSPTAPFRALLFDSWYDEYKGVVSLFAVKDGRVRRGNWIVRTA